MSEFKPGIYDISIEEYHSSNGVSRSSLMKLKKSRFHYWYEYLSGKSTKEEDTAAQIFGNAMHTMVLEPSKFDDRYFVSEKFDRRTTAGKTAHQQMLVEAGNRILITEDIHFKLQKMVESINSNPQAFKLLQDGRVEQSLYWTDPDTGILCKARPDLWHHNMVIDLKTTLSADYRAFQGSCYKYGYHIQAGMIQEAIKHTTGKLLTEFIFVAIEKEEPHATAVYVLDKDAIAFGVQEFKSLLVKLKDSQETNNWGSYETQLLTLPEYVRMEIAA